MQAMVLERQKHPLVEKDIPKPIPEAGQLLIKVHTCGICRTDLHILDGELKDPKLPLVPGHQIVGTVEKIGLGVGTNWMNQKVGIPWLWSSYEVCQFCSSGKENLCDDAKYTGYHVNGGFAEYVVANAKFCFPIPEGYPDTQSAPLLCAGLIGYRALRFTEGKRRIGFYGFGASAHILTQVASFQNREVYAFTKPGDSSGQKFALKMGAVWAGDSGQSPPCKLDAAIIFAPAGELIPAALQALDKGGVVVCAGIHMSDIPSFPYRLLWEERVIRSVANLTRLDGEEFLALAPEVPVVTEVTSYPLGKVNEALEDLRNGVFRGAAVIEVGA